MTRFYIAHTFSKRHWVRDNLCPAVQTLGIGTSNPFYNPDGTIAKWRPEVGIADKFGECDKFWYEVRHRKKNIVITDVRLIDDCDGIIACMDEESTGTASEMFYAGFVQSKPVFLLTNNERLFNHPWILYETRKGGIFHNLEELIECLKKKYKK